MLVFWWMKKLVELKNVHHKVSTILKSFKFFFSKFFEKKILKIFITWTRNPWHGGVYIPYGKSRLRGFEKIYVGRLFSGYLKYLLSWGVWGRGWPLKRLRWQKPLEMGWVWLKRTPSTTIGQISWFSWGCHCTSFKKNCC